MTLGPTLWLSQGTAPRTQRQGSGAIVHVTPITGLAGLPVERHADAAS